jgi:hypothetical protein
MRSGSAMHSSSTLTLTSCRDIDELMCSAAMNAAAAAMFTGSTSKYARQ